MKKIQERMTAYTKRQMSGFTVANVKRISFAAACSVSKISDGAGGTTIPMGFVVVEYTKAKDAIIVRSLYCDSDVAPIKQALEAAGFKIEIIENPLSLLNRFQLKVTQ